MKELINEIKKIVEQDIDNDYKQHISNRLDFPTNVCEKHLTQQQILVQEQLKLEYEQQHLSIILHLFIKKLRNDNKINNKLNDDKINDEQKFLLFIKKLRNDNKINNKQNNNETSKEEDLINLIKSLPEQLKNEYLWINNMHFTANNTSLAKNKLENKSNNLSIIKESDELPPNQTQESIKKHQNNTSKNCLQDILHCLLRLC